MCQHCLNEAELERGAGMSFSAGGDAGVGEVEGSGTGTGNSLGADLVRSMPGLGGCGAVVDPYGLASRGRRWVRKRCGGRARWGGGQAGLEM